MQAKGWMFFNVLANRYHSGSKEALLQYQPESETQEALKNDVSSQDISLATIPAKEKLKRIHYSWLLKNIEPLPNEFKELVLASLDKNQANSIREHLKVDGKKTLPEPVAQFIAKIFYDNYVGDASLPAAFLPSTPLSFLLTYDKEQLMELADHLGLYDLSHDIRQIVDKARLQKLFVALTPSMQKFLKVCLVQRDWLKVPPLPLGQWDGQRAALLKMIHQRGLERLGKALSGQSEELITHISCRLDTGRGAILKKNWTEEPLETAGPALEAQLLNLIKYIKTRE